MTALLGRYVDSLSQNGRYGHLKSIPLTTGWGLLNEDLSHYKIAIVDLLLPQITGVDLIKDFRTRYPKMGIVPISGMATHTMKKTLKGLLPQGIELLPKPLKREDFFRAFDLAWSHTQNHHQQLGLPKLPPSVEGSEDLWTAPQPSLSLDISVEHRKLLRKKTGT